ncbi:putative calcineurin-like phosphoesterase [Bacillus phage PBC6]|nr:putative calcineurin-like phosphoesterase [Bacillus phage PBC6]
MRERGKIAPAVFNKIIVKLGYSKLKNEQLLAEANKMENDIDTKNLYLKAWHGYVTLDEIPHAYNEDESIKEENVFSYVTNYLMDKEDNATRLRELRKLQKDGTIMALLMKDLKKHLVEELKGLPRMKYLKTEPTKPQVGDKTLILALSDWHVGFVSHDMHTGDHNFERLKTSIQEIVSYTLRTVQERDIKEVHVLFLGDLVENFSMRSTQSFDLEFTFAQQISKGLGLLLDVLIHLSKFVPVTFSMVAGNHDRFESDKKTAIFNNSVAYHVLDTLIMTQEKLGQIPNVTITDNRKDVYRFDLDIAGQCIAGAHGDHLSKSNEKIPAFMTHGRQVDILFTGHLHSFKTIQESFTRLHMQVGSPIGENSYSRQGNYPTTTPSQEIVILTEGTKIPELIPLWLGHDGKLL